MKHFPLKFIQIAWPCEAIAILIFTIIAVIVLPLERINLWIQFLPVFSGLIAAQGAAGGIGPLVSDKIKANGGNHE